MTVASMSFAQKAARVARLLRPFGAPQLQAFAPPAETGYRMRSEFRVYVSARLHVCTRPALQTLVGLLRLWH